MGVKTIKRQTRDQGSACGCLIAGQYLWAQA